MEIPLFYSGPQTPLVNDHNAAVLAYWSWLYSEEFKSVVYLSMMLLIKKRQ